jgi:hypothetical protein
MLAFRARDDRIEDAFSLVKISPRNNQLALSDLQNLIVVAIIASFIDGQRQYYPTVSTMSRAVMALYKRRMDILYQRECSVQR